MTDAELREAIRKWSDYVKSLKLSKKREKFIIGHPVFFKESEQFFNLKKSPITEKE